MNVNVFVTKEYEESPHPRARKNKANSKPISRRRIGYGHRIPAGYIPARAIPAIYSYVYAIFHPAYLRVLLFEKQILPEQLLFRRFCPPG